MWTERDSNNTIKEMLNGLIKEEPYQAARLGRDKYERLIAELQKRLSISSNDGESPTILLNN